MRVGLMVGLLVSATAAAAAGVRQQQPHAGALTPGEASHARPLGDTEGEAPGDTTGGGTPAPVEATDAGARSPAPAGVAPAPASAAGSPETSGPTDAPAPEAQRAFGPFRLGTAGNSIEPGLAAQLRFTLDKTDGAPPTQQLELRRLRLFVRGTLWDGRLAFQVQLHTTPAALELLDAWADVRVVPGLRVRVGQFKTPFTRFRQQSFQALALPDWPVFATHFGAERQLGAMLHEGGADTAHWTYALGVFTGVNARASFERGLSTVYAEPLTNPSDLRAFHGPTSFHPELVARVGHEAAGVRSSSDSDEAGGPLRHSAALSAAWDLRPSYPTDFAGRLAPEVLLKWNHLFLDVVLALGWYRHGSAVDLASVGENVEAGWRFHPRVEVSGRYSRVDNTKSVRDDARARAEALVAAAAPSEQASVATKYAAAGTPRWTQEVALGLNVFIVGDSLKWQSDLGWVRTVGANTSDEVRFRTQLQLAF